MSPVEPQFHVPLFPPFPSAERYVRVGSQDDALQRVMRAVEAWEAISLVIGPPGTGKSLICRMLKNHFASQREVIVFGDATLESPTALQRHLLSRLDRIRGIAAAPASAQDDPQLAIMERIASSSPEFAGLLLLVDEAQDLSPETLDTIRMLTNAMTSDGRPCVSAVLVGGPKLDETLALPSLEALVQRVATRCYVHPLSSDETIHYVSKVLQRSAGWGVDAIDEAAIRSIHRACSGVPRLINQLMNASVEFAKENDEREVTTQTVDQAWAILQQLPSPILEEPEIARPTSEIEFGLLDEDDSAASSEGNFNAGMCDAGECNADECDSAKCEADDCESDASHSESTYMELELTLDDESDFEYDEEPLAVAESKPSITLNEQAEGSVWEDPKPELDDISLAGEGMHLGIISEDAIGIGSLSMDCQTIGAFQCDTTSCEDSASELEDQEATETARNESTLSPDNLFGDFEEEEPIVGAVDGKSVADSAFALDQDNSHSDDLETSLHQEILSLRGAAAAPVLWVEDEDGTSVDDDRDLLVIEDDVDVDGVAVQNEVEVDEKPANTVAVDFQAMLAKMRSPNR
ncbi:Type II secretory pathway, component ExeA (predicted ATPase) [Neorhodopirellula lusitana]|uniref:Type II secretory pathway, component ExeA (Predicted ATPase) n=1 Tax=Neorhodopirellula lusitana TaxID=445327 RepID=A0ABY1QS42_9BACT|nr:AAA family ATPase [Neorhodopirellula lusitana]SMP77366.1 Type II secretory pathway, component ExeA (predicted ATPase) [Neorhodopirellula lusitana]